LEVLENSKPTAPQPPKPKPKPEHPKRKRLRTKPKMKKVTKVVKEYQEVQKFKYSEADIEMLTDEELETAIMAGMVRFDEDEL
jgi:hypothetical protein